MQRDIFLDSVPLADALAKWFERLHSEGALQPLTGEKIRAIESLGRITAEAVAARISSPFYHAAASAHFLC